jgi:hypothetical protein
MRTGADANSNDPYLPKTTLEKAGCPDPDLVFASIISLQAWEPYPTGGNGSSAITTPIAVDTEPTLEVPNTPEEGGGLDEDGILIDFTTGEALVIDSVGTTDFDGDVNALLTYTAPSPKMVWNAAGVLVSGTTIRCDHDPVTHEPLGVLIEEQRTNLILQSGTLATQSVTVTAAAHTISFWGIGTVALSGAFVGALAGTGAANRVSLTFTPTAGSLTLTVTGIVSNAQLELGAFASSYIPTTTAQVTRAADNISLATSAFPYNVPAGTLMAEADCPFSSEAFWGAPAALTDVSGDDSINLYNSLVDVWDNGVQQARLWLTEVAAGNFKVAAAWALNDFAAVNNANTLLTDNLGTIPSPTKLVFGADYGGVASTSLRGGHVKRLKYLPRRATNAELVEWTT